MIANKSANCSACLSVRFLQLLILLVSSTDSLMFSNPPHNLSVVLLHLIRHIRLSDAYDVDRRLLLGQGCQRPDSEILFNGIFFFWKNQGYHH